MKKSGPMRDCAKLLVSLHSTIGGEKLKVVHRKYSDPQKGAVAVLPPAKYLMPESSSSDTRVLKGLDK
ncbi:unnamed protein product [Lupinus luteus]|uniref:Cyclin C-terminal domain-containing protein n=1 Tax=Lupinus luteus TaxID=3873 RepID=A0AAV1XMF8_LUPLU